MEVVVRVVTMTVSEHGGHHQQTERWHMGQTSEVRSHELADETDNPDDPVQELDKHLLMVGVDFPDEQDGRQCARVCGAGGERGRPVLEKAVHLRDRVKRRKRLPLIEEIVAGGQQWVTVQRKESAGALKVSERGFEVPAADATVTRPPSRWESPGLARVV
ncbi:hypothetical protein [Nonomuraea longicatena]|uniref:hypothetical protein n=1 Tax=Nonomuraea longicatena TaxID=83682 RepID=UPI0031D76750